MKEIEALRNGMKFAVWWFGVWRDGIVKIGSPEKKVSVIADDIDKGKYDKDLLDFAL